MLNGPTNPIVKEMFPEQTEKYDRFLYNENASGKFLFLDTETSGNFVEQDFVDLAHLNQKGREKLHKLLVEFLKIKEYDIFYTKETKNR